ncbi:hypothetical protein [Streptomyces sp. NPDC001880]
MRVSRRDRRVLVFRGARATFEVKVVPQGTYTPLEVVGPDVASGAEAQTLLWGAAAALQSSGGS